MNSTNSTEEQSTSMPRVATWLLSRLANPIYRDVLIGDMEEEYTERQPTGYYDKQHWQFGMDKTRW
jgi:hypothetical protein